MKTQILLVVAALISSPALAASQKNAKALAKITAPREKMAQDIARDIKAGLKNEQVLKIVNDNSKEYEALTDKHYAKGLHDSVVKYYAKNLTDKEINAVLKPAPGTDPNVALKAINDKSLPVIAAASKEAQTNMSKKLLEWLKAKAQKAQGQESAKK